MASTVFVSVDLEGITGVVHPVQAVPGERDYPRFRKIMMREANAVVDGAFEAGADSVIVNDSHDGMLNLEIEGLDERAQLISGVNKPLSMMQGISGDVVCAFFVGYHSMASGMGVLSHTMTTIVSRAWLNGQPASEAVINAMIAGQFNVPVALIAGDQYAVSELKAVCPKVYGVVVKQALDRYAALNRPIVEVERELKRAASSAVTNCSKMSPFKPSTPIRLRVEFSQPNIASKAALMNSVQRVDERTVEIQGDNGLEVWAAFYSSLSLGSSAKQESYG
ncbi:MAG: M55 family metallopeptidase [Thermoprotei archaeon]